MASYSKAKQGTCECSDDDVKWALIDVIEHEQVDEVVYYCTNCNSTWRHLYAKKRGDLNEMSSVWI